MTPISFKEQTNVLQKPPGLTDDQCSPLPIWSDGTQCVSCWRPTWREALSILISRRVWVCVLGGATQPPIALTGARTIFRVRNEK